MKSLDFNVNVQERPDKLLKRKFTDIFGNLQT